MTTIVIIIVIVLTISYFIGKIKRVNSSDSTKKSVKNKPNPDNLLYKAKGIKIFEIKGMYYRDLKPETHAKSFVGYALCENNSHDKNAVGIYNERGELLGYTPKGNKRLHNSLQEWHDGQILAWGDLSFNNYNDKWDGIVNIPIGISENQIETIKQFLELKNRNLELVNRKEKNTDKYFEILHNHSKIKGLQSKLDNPEVFYYSLPINIMSSISSHLEKKKDWNSLLELENYPDLIEVLNDKFKAATIKRIEKGKKNSA